MARFIFNRERLYYEYKPVHVHFTTGRTSNSVPVLYTAYDLERLKEAGKRMIDTFGINPNEILINCFPYAPHLAFWQVVYAANAVNMMALHTGGGKILGTEKIIASIEGMKATIMAVMPGYGYHLLKKASGTANLNSLKYILFGGERVPKGLKEKIKQLAKNKELKVLSTYAFTEGKVAWPQCSENSGYHLYPDMEYIEIVDEHGEQVGENEKGEIVYTSLDFRGSIFLRYKTGDLGKIQYGKCVCGKTIPRISADIERKSEIKEFSLTKIKGSLVNLNTFFDILMGNKNVDEWQVQIQKRNNDPYEIDELILFISPKKNVDFFKLEKQLQEIISSEMEISPEIIKKDHKEILEMLGMETQLKEKRIVDRRKDIVPQLNN